MRRWWRLAAVVVAALMIEAGLPAARPPAAQATQAACSEPPEDDASALVFVSEPAGAQGFATGAAPFTVEITIVQGVLSYEAGFLTSAIRWGDGTFVPVVATPCGDGDWEIAGQSHRHTYATAGQYQVDWDFQIPGFPITIPLLFVDVTAAADTPTPVPPTATATIATSTAVPGATATATPRTPTPGPGTTAPATGTSATAGPTRPGATVTATARPGSTTPGPSPGTQTPTATSTPSPAPAAGGEGTGTTPGPTATLRPGEPEIARWIPGPADVSTDPAVTLTNVVVAGVTVWVLFSSVLLDQVMADRREDLEARLGAAARAAKRLRRGTGGGGAGRRRGLFDFALVLGITGVTYSFLEPGTGFDRATAVMLISAVAGIGVATLAADGVEALATRRWTGTPAAVRAYPAAIVIAVVSVAVSRGLDLAPGVMYGFVASCVALRPLDLDRRGEGRLAAIPIVSALVLSVLAWLAVGPIRAMESTSFVALALEATLVVIFIGGIEGLALSLIPLGVTDGGKVYRWSRPAWVALTAIAAFLVWQVLLGRERAYFDGLREASSLAVIAVFGGYSVLTVGLWAWLRPRHHD